MKDLTPYLNKVNQATDLETAVEATLSVINNSHATVEKKQESHRILAGLPTHEKVVAFAYNFALSGEGLKVV